MTTHVTATDSTYFLGMWFIPFGPVADLMATLYQETPGGPYQLTGRLRIYDPTDPHNDAFSGKDRKISFAAERPAKESPQEIIRMTQESLQKMATKTAEMLQRPHEPIRYVEIMGNAERMQYVLAQQDFVHIKHLPANSPEARALHKEATP